MRLTALRLVVDRMSPLQSWPASHSSIVGDKFSADFNGHRRQIGVGHHRASGTSAHAQIEENRPMIRPGYDRQTSWCVMQLLRKNSSVVKFAGAIKNLCMSDDAEEAVEHNGGDRKRLVSIDQRRNEFSELLVTRGVSAKCVDEHVNV